jgi:hypothetical protein
MNKAKLIIPALALVLFALALPGCKLVEERTMRECMDQFADAVNSGSLDGIHDCLHPDANDYNTTDAAFWETYFGPETGDGNDFSASISGTMATAYWDGFTYTFFLKMEDTDYFSIYEVRKGGSIIFN